MQMEKRHFVITFYSLCEIFKEMEEDKEQMLMFNNENRDISNDAISFDF